MYEMTERVEGEDTIRVRQHTNSDALLAVVLIDDDGRDGSREDDVETIVVMVQGVEAFRLTWRQARALAAAVNEVEQIGRLG